MPALSSPSGSTRRAVGVYLVMVGTPLLGLLVIFHVGKDMDAPASVGGRWLMESTSTRVLPDSCVAPPFIQTAPEMTVLQSGRYIQLRFGDDERTVMTGRLRGNVLRLVTSPTSDPNEQGGCPAGSTALEAVISREAGSPDRMSGSLRAACDSCPEHAFMAVRVCGPTC